MNEGRSPSGAARPATGWTLFAPNVWASIKTTNARVTDQNGVERMRAESKLTMRYMAGVRPGMIFRERLPGGDRVDYLLETAVDPDNKRAWLECVAVKQARLVEAGIF